MSDDIRTEDLQQAIAREMAKPEAMTRNHDLINWAQGLIDDRANPGATAARSAFERHQQANGKATEKSPLPAMQAYLDRCVARCQKNLAENQRTKVKANVIVKGKA